MSVEMNPSPVDESTEDRREAKGERVPFGGVVEVGGALGPSFEAEAVDVSFDGIHLRTAYLPELGQPLTCRIEVGSEVVLAAGEVVWRQEQERGGEFGLHFTDLDAQSDEALKRLVAAEPEFQAKGPGMRVRLHIEGLGAPMRARIKGSAAEGLVVGSELGFLQVGKELELEDAKTGGKRAARIDRVSVEVNPETQIPQLVVSLRYDVADTDAPGTAASAPHVRSAEDTPEPTVIDDDKPRGTLAGIGRGEALRTEPRGSRRPSESADESLGPLRSGLGEAFQRASAKVGPALASFGAQAKTTFGLVVGRAQRAAAKNEDGAQAPRRTTAPAPTGGLHATGRKVVRNEPASAMAALEGKSPDALLKRRAALATAVLLAGVIGFAALHKSAPKPEAPVATETTAPASSVTGLGASAPPPPAAPALPVASAAPAPVAPALAPVPPEDPTPSNAAPATEDVRPRTHRTALHVTPFGNGAVGHANVLHLKMDGAIEKIEGATTPTGFTVVIPSRRSLEAAAPLASRDSRIAAIRVTNEAGGAELSVNFKDGVPNYQVRAKGDLLEILLAPQGKLTDQDDGVKTAKKKRSRR